MLQAALDWLHMMALISQECASCTGSKPDYIMETVPSVQFRSWSLLVSRHTQKVEAFVLHRHDLDGISALGVPATHSTANEIQCIGTTLWG